MSNPPSRSARALRSSRALHQMKSLTSGWSTFSTTIFAARRVLPPDLMVPALASAPRMKLTGPLAVPPPRLQRATEILLRDDVRGVLRPALGELHVPLLERVPALLEVRDDGVARLPFDLVERMNAFLGEVPLEGDPLGPRPEIPLLR